MKLTTLTAIMLLSSATYAFAGGGAPVPEGAMKDDPSGRPGKVLTDSECQKAWETAGPDGDIAMTDDNPPSSQVSLLNLFPLTVIAALVIAGVAFLVSGFRAIRT